MEALDYQILSKESKLGELDSIIFIRVTIIA